MKINTNTILEVNVGMDVDLIESMAFRFRQGTVEKDFTYPSSTAYKLDDRTIALKWSAADTMMFSVGQCGFDTKITLADSDENPQTPMSTITFDRTLFDEVEDAED